MKRRILSNYYKNPGLNPGAGENAPLETLGRGEAFPPSPPVTALVDWSSK